MINVFNGKEMQFLKWSALMQSGTFETNTFKCIALKSSSRFGASDEMKLDLTTRFSISNNRIALAQKLCLMISWLVFAASAIAMLNHMTKVIDT